MVQYTVASQTTEHGTALKAVWTFEGESRKHIDVLKSKVKTEEAMAVILDNGSCTCKAGFANEMKPRYAY